MVFKRANRKRAKQFNIVDTQYFEHIKKTHSLELRVRESMVKSTLAPSGLQHKNKSLAPDQLLSWYT
jgi:hypothetical protein